MPNEECVECSLRGTWINPGSHAGFDFDKYQCSKSDLL